jgi:uncharacterized protein YjiS (DUF1127 family)
MEADVTPFSNNDAISTEHAPARSGTVTGTGQIARWVSAALWRVAKSLSEWRTSREAYRELGRLTDRDLEDIGVDRADLPNSVRIGGWPWR